MRWLPVAVLAVAAAFLTTLDAVAVRQASVVGMGKCSVRQLLNLPQRIEFIALGSSRVRAGISTEAIEHTLGSAPSSAFNFGRSGLSTLRSYITLRDAMDRGVRPRYVFLEVDLDALQDAQDASPIKMPVNAAFMKYADTALMLELPEGRSSLSIARLCLLTLLDKIRGSVIPVLSMDPLWATLQPGAAPVASCQAGADFERTERGERALDALRRNLPARGAADDHAVREYRAGANGSAARQQELLFVGKVRELAHAHGATLLVARHGQAYEPPLSESAIEAVHRDVPEFVQAPADVVRATWADFLDATHMGPQARVIYSTWLAGLMSRPAKQ